MNKQPILIVVSAAFLFGALAISGALAYDMDGMDEA
jgi:hypothetical protein